MIRKLKYIHYPKEMEIDKKCRKIKPSKQNNQMPSYTESQRRQISRLHGHIEKSLESGRYSRSEMKGKLEKHGLNNIEEYAAKLYDAGYSVKMDNERGVFHIA